MPNAVEEALNRANEQKRDDLNQKIQDAEYKIESAKMQMGNSPSGELSAIIANNEQIIAEARQSIPTETMKSVDTIGAPLNTPSPNATTGFEQQKLNPLFQSQIENIEQSGGNNYLNQNAVDRAMAKPTQEIPSIDQQQQSLER